MFSRGEKLNRIIERLLYQLQMYSAKPLEWSFKMALFLVEVNSVKKLGVGAGFVRVSLILWTSLLQLQFACLVK